MTIGVPVGFVNAMESKQALTETSLKYITSTGRKGGSTVAVAILNALLASPEIEPMRNGFSTSACVRAASVAALRSLVSGEPVDCVVIDLPVMKRVTFDIARCEKQSDGICCGVVKDAGDDPDVTNGWKFKSWFAGLV